MIEKQTKNNSEEIREKRQSARIIIKSARNLLIYDIVMLFIIILLNILVWTSESFCEFYINNIFHYVAQFVSRITGLFPFSVGEYLIIMGIILVVLAIILGIILLVCKICKKKSEKLLHFSIRYFNVCLIIFLNVCLVMSLNCTMLYHCRAIDPNPSIDEREYTMAELLILRNYIVNELNRYSELVDRDENGNIYYAYHKEDEYTEAAADEITQSDAMKDAARTYMQNISNEFPRLSGYYPRVKDMLFSDLMSQSYMAGYYFPFSLEANCNADMYITNYPSTYCHELAHLHGYIYEYDASYIAYLACMESGDSFFIYCELLEVYDYLENAYYDSLVNLALAEGMNDDEIKQFLRASYKDVPKICEAAENDNIFLSPETWEKVEKNAVISTEKVEKISETFVDTSLKVNGIEEGMATYSEIVGMLLQYYDGELY